MKKIVSLLLMCALLISLLPMSALAAQREFYINTSLSVVDGKTTITWVDTANYGPYIVAYRLVDPSSNATQALYPAGDDIEASTTSQKSFVCGDLIAGRRYMLLVQDAYGEQATTTITMPAAQTFQDGKLKAANVRVNLSPRYMRSSGDSPRGIDYLSASDIRAHIEEYYYGLRYEFSMPELAYDRTYWVQIVMTAPNGYTDTVHTSTKTFGTGTGWSYYLSMCGSNFFYNMYQKNSTIPTGTYTIELYFNGMLANTKTFTVR